MENSFAVIEKLNIINIRKRAKKISSYDFSTLHTSITDNLLIKVLSEILNFVFKSKARSEVVFSATYIYWNSKGLGKRYSTEKSIMEAITSLIKNCYFTIGNKIFKQNFGIPMGIDSAPFWKNMFPYFFEPKHVQNLISKY